MKHTARRSRNALMARKLQAMLPRLWRFGLFLTQDACEVPLLIELTLQALIERSDRAVQNEPCLRVMIFREMCSIWAERAQTLECLRDGADCVGLKCNCREGRPTGEDGRPNNVVTATAMLPDCHRAMVLLTCVEGLSREQTAYVLDAPIDIVESVLTRARIRLGAELIACKQCVDADLAPVDVDVEGAGRRP